MRGGSTTSSRTSGTVDSIRKGGIGSGPGFCLAARGLDSGRRWMTSISVRPDARTISHPHVGGGTPHSTVARAGRRGPPRRRDRRRVCTSGPGPQQARHPGHASRPIETVTPALTCFSTDRLLANRRIPCSSATVGSARPACAVERRDPGLVRTSSITSYSPVRPRETPSGAAGRSDRLVRLDFELRAEAVVAEQETGTIVRRLQLRAERAREPAARHRRSTREATRRARSPSRSMRVFAEARRWCEPFERTMCPVTRTLDRRSGPVFA